MKHSARQKENREGREGRAAPSGGARPHKKWYALIAMAAVALLGFTVYYNSLSGAFLWDDEFLVRDNIYIKNWSDAPHVFTRDIGAGAKSKFNFYRPIQLMTYMFDYSVWKLDTRGYHLTNALLHTLVALCIWRFITVLFGDGLLAFLTSVLFLVHPIHTEAVSYIAGRADSLAALFIFLSLIFYVKNLRSGGAAACMLAPLCYCLALLSRENSLILPVLIVLYHYTFRERFQIRKILPILCIALLYIVVRLTLLRALLSNITYDTTLAQRIPGFFVAITNYLRIIAFPIDLHMEYGNRLFEIITPKALAGILILSLLSIYAWKIRKSKRLVFFGISWFFLALLPVSNLYPINAYMAEHWLYLPSMGFCLILAQWLCSVYRTKNLQGLAMALMVGLAGVYSYITIRQNDYWREPVAFYQRTLKYASDAAKMHYNLGNVYKDSGRKEEAIASYKKAIEADPNYSQAYTNLGLIYNAIDKKDEAIASYKKAIEIDPAASRAYNNLGITYHDLGRRDEAIASYKKAIDIDPNYAQSYNNLGIVYDDMGKKDEAIAAYKKAIELDGRDAYAYNNLGSVYHDMGKKDEALAAYKKAIELDSTLKYGCYTYTNLGVLYDSLGKSAEAIAALTKATEINPRYAQAYGNLAIAYFHAKQYRLAIDYYDKAQTLGFSDPALSQALKPYREQ